MSNKDLIIKEISNSPLVKKEYKAMLDNIHTTLPAIKQSSSNFYKSHSQFMGVMLDVTAITPIRSVKHTLAEIDKTRMALEEAHLKMRKKDIELREKEYKLKTDLDMTEFDKELLETEILEIQVNMNNIQNSITGAIRKMNFFTNQYKSILKKLGKEDITEEEYEKEEANYHVMTCMKQALNAARSRGGVIDEGKAPTHEMTMQWLEACADKFSKDANTFAERRGFKLYDEESLNTKLIDNRDTTNGK